jgi:hypothetical protein
MPHERGPSPVPPSEFCVLVLADPKFASPLASQPHYACQRIVCLTFRQTIDK